MTFRRSKKLRPISSAFEDDFAIEILKGDRLRVSILIGVIITAQLTLFIMAALFYDTFQQAFHGNFRGFLFTVVTVMGSALVWLSIERYVIGRLVAKRKKAFALLQYVSAFVETSIPTAGMIVGATFLGPIYTLFTPATLIYPLFIVLSALRLNARLCIFTGAVAGVEYSLLAVYFVSKFSDSTIEPILAGIPHHLFKGFLLFLTGVVTGLVALQVKKRILNSFNAIEERNRIS